MEIRGLVFDIERFAIHDGPGIRTTLFLKGCPLACWWCHNPESIAPRSQLAFFDDKCISCGRCFEACPRGVHERLADGSRLLHREKCVACGRCTESCFAEALVLEGREMTVEEAVAELRKDAPFYESSGGGITLSGGEPMHQAAFCEAVLRACRSEGMRTALDTSGHAPWDDFASVLPHVDLVLYDFKHADPGEHLKYTGVSNELLRENLLRIDVLGIPIEIRIPIVPGVNDDAVNMERSARIISRLRNVTGVTLLPYHRLGEEKYQRIGRSYRLRDLQPPSRERMDELAAFLVSRGLQARAR